MSLQINQIFFSAHPTFGFYLTLTLQYHPITIRMFATQKDVFFALVSVKRDFKCVT